MEVHLTSWNEDGRGRGEDRGRTVLVTHGYPGERVAVAVDRESRNVVQGRTKVILHSAAGLRVPHGCAHEFSCTGCPFLSVPPELEAEWKKQRIARALMAIQGEELPFQFLQPGAPFGYRHLAKAVIGTHADRVIWGSYRAGTHDLSDNAGCPVLHPDLSDDLNKLCALATRLRVPVHGPDGLGLKAVVMRRSRATGESIATFVVTHPDDAAFVELALGLVSNAPRIVGIVVKRGLPEDNVLLRGETVFRHGRTQIEEDLLGFRHTLGPDSFFQVNPQAAEVLFREAVALVPEGCAALEGYAGVGALTLPLLLRTGRVHAIEAEPQAAAALFNLDRLGLTTEHASVPDVLASRLASESFEVCVFDPPRRGLHPPVIAALAQRPVPMLVLLHCSLDAFTRDGRALRDIGYVLDTALGVDQFPRTAHVEMVTRFLHSS